MSDTELDTTKYMPCKCGSKEFYVSYAGDTCCHPCFKPLIRVSEPKKIDMTAYVEEKEDGWSVTVNGKLIEFFSKYEDFASTEARKLALKLNATNGA